jgi:flagellar motor component MotA
MDKTLKFELSGDDPDEIKKLLDQYIEVLDRDHTERAKIWEEIDRTNAANEAARIYLRELIRKAA